MAIGSMMIQLPGQFAFPRHQILKFHEISLWVKHGLTMFNILTSLDPKVTKVIQV
jgi:hypothetical protein